MTRYVALLRGVNVGGITVKSADLAEVVRGLGYDDVKTVLASGNVLFTTGEPASTATPRLEAALGERFGYEAWVHVLTAEAVAAIAADYPFARSDDRHAYVVFVVKPDSTVEQRPVTTGQAAGEDVVITKGLATGETVVTEGQLRLEPGTHVTLADPTTGEAAAPAAGNGANGRGGNGQGRGRGGRGGRNGGRG